MKKFRSLCLLLLIMSCSNEPYDKGQFFFLVNKNAEMPVMVRGNIASGVLILFLHGGPGGSALQKIGLPAFNTLEQSYGVVFWDQRSSGSSQGNSPDKYFTLQQFTEDLDKLVDLLLNKYDHPRIFLMGHSWGGCLGTAYLSQQSHQNKIKGWIEVDGAHNNPLGDSLSMHFVLSYARQQIANKNEEPFWSYVLSWYDKNPNFTSDQMEHYAFVEKAKGYIHDSKIKRDPAHFPEYTYGYLFDSPADVTQALTNFNRVIKKFIISDIDLTEEMRNITLPSIIIWGKFDGVIPYPAATNALKSLGTPDSKKRIETLGNSGHTGFYEEPDQFATAVINFIEENR